MPQDRWLKINLALVSWIPSGIVYWCFMRVWCYATSGEYSKTLVAHITCDEALRRWDYGRTSWLRRKKKKYPPSLH
jgi:hypothetical protein